MISLVGSARVTRGGEDAGGSRMGNGPRWRLRARGSSAGLTLFLRQHGGHGKVAVDLVVDVVDASDADVVQDRGRVEAEPRLRDLGHALGPAVAVVGADKGRGSCVCGR